MKPGDLCIYVGKPIDVLWIYADQRLMNPSGSITGDDICVVIAAKYVNTSGFTGLVYVLTPRSEIGWHGSSFFKKIESP